MSQFDPKRTSEVRMCYNRAPHEPGPGHSQTGGIMSGLDPSYIMQVGMGFFASKTLLSAVELELFSDLAKQPMTGKEIAATLQLSPRAIPDFPDALVALKFLERQGDGPEARYSNTPE